MWQCCLLASVVSEKKCAIIPSFVSSYVIFFFMAACVKILLLAPIFSTLIMMPLGVVFLLFLLFWFH